MSIEKHRNPNGTYDGAAIMGELTGLGKGAMLEIWEEVKANKAKADACPEHELTPYVPFSKVKRTCTKCGAWFTFDQAYKIDKAKPDEYPPMRDEFYPGKR
jgi:hypothetical protein